MQQQRTTKQSKEVKQNDVETSDSMEPPNERTEQASEGQLNVSGGDVATNSKPVTGKQKSTK